MYLIVWSATCTFHLHYRKECSVGFRKREHDPQLHSSGSSTESSVCVGLLINANLVTLDSEGASATYTVLVSGMCSSMFAFSFTFKGKTSFLPLPLSLSVNHAITFIWSFYCISLSHLIFLVEAPSPSPPSLSPAFSLLSTAQEVKYF